MELMMPKLMKIFFIITIISSAYLTNLYASDDFNYTIQTTANQASFVDGKASISGGEENAVIGRPQVGYKIVRVILPQGTTLDSITTESSEPKILASGMHLDISRGDININVESSVQNLAVDSQTFSSDSAYPTARAKVLYSGYWGNIHLADLAVYPLAYWAQPGNLELFDKIRVTFKLSQINPELESRLKGDPIAYSALMETAENQNDLIPYASTNVGRSSHQLICTTPQTEYLLITTDSLAVGFEPYFEWKNQKGLASRIVLIENILSSTPGIDSPEKLRNYLIDAHTSGVRWVLLGGDEDIIPIRYLYAGNTDSTSPPLSLMQIGDIYYSDLTGNWDADSDGIYGETMQDQRDIYPEVYVGRVPVRSVSEAEIWVEKAITYEKNPGNGDPSYLGKALVICADEMRDLNQQSTVANWLSHNFNVDAQRLIEQPDGGSPSPTQPTGQQVIDVMQEGWGFISDQNHGDFSYYASQSPGYNEAGRSAVWGDTVFLEHDAGYSHLTDNDKPGIHYSTACDVGAFDFDKGVFYPGPYYTTYTLAESYLNQPGGGAAFLGYSRWGWAVGSLTLENKFVRRVLVDSTCNLGVAEALSKTDYPTFSDIIYGHNLYGDPEMPFWISVSGALNISGPEVVAAKQNHVVVFHVTAGNNPAANAKVCLYKANEIFIVSNTDEQGEVSFEIEPESVGVMTVTATLPRYIPAQNIISIQSFSGVSDELELPSAPEIAQNYPNPFNSSTVITFSLSHEDKVKIEIFDIGGRLVQVFGEKEFPAGANRIVWNGKNDAGNDIASGLYFYRFECADYSSVKQMTLLR
jgi:hypothetical protein